MRYIAIPTLIFNYIWLFKFAIPYRLSGTITVGVLLGFELIWVPICVISSCIMTKKQFEKDKANKNCPFEPVKPGYYKQKKGGHVIENEYVSMISAFIVIFGATFFLWGVPFIYCYIEGSLTLYNYFFGLLVAGFLSPVTAPICIILSLVLAGKFKNSCMKRDNPYMTEEQKEDELVNIGAMAATGALIGGGIAKSVLDENKKTSCVKE